MTEHWLGVHHSSDAIKKRPHHGYTQTVLFQDWLNPSIMQIKNSDLD